MVFAAFCGGVPAVSEESVTRPTISGFHFWRYNKFSSYDQLRVNFEREYGKNRKLFASMNGLYYQEDDNKSWTAFCGETYYKFRVGPFDYKLGLLTETIGSGDKVSFVDKINSRRYYSGLANDYNRDKKEVPAVKVTYYFNKKRNVEIHYLPVFQASEMPSIYGKWATAFQQVVALDLLLGGAYLQREKDTRLREQYHIAYNSSFKRYEIRYHYLRMKERIPVIELYRTGYYKWTYPLDETYAIDGNVTLTKEFLMRFELAYTIDKTYSTFANKRVGYHFRSDQYNMLLGTDHTFKNNMYVNLQGLMSHIADMKDKTPLQVAPTEYMASLQMRKGFKSETLFVEFNAYSNLTTGEYVLTPQIQLQRGDYLKLVAGVHYNGRSTDRLGPIGQFDKNNTPFFETQVLF